MESGKFISLRDILSGNSRIIIPDLQRDYCWGTVNNLASNFTKSLVEASAREVSQFSLGLLYAYQYPAFYYYLCDGQQRVTTLYLIMGVLNCYEKDRDLERALNLGYGEPRLRYEVRNSTVYFLKHLLVEVFNEQNADALDKLQGQNWWRKEFESDPSIKSLCKALVDIHAQLKSGADQRALLKAFIKEKVGFVFFDLKVKDAHLNTIQVREFGEKMYEIVNTRGVPMEPNEHLKPILLSQDTLSAAEKEAWTETWESWQDFFWIKRGKNETGDYGFNEFLRWIAIIELSIGNKEDEESGQALGANNIKELFKADKINFDYKGPELIRDYFDALKWLVEKGFGFFKEKWLSPSWTEVEKNGVKKRIIALTQIDYFTLLPALCYVRRVGFHRIDEPSFVRLLRFFENLKKDDTISKAPDVYTISALKALQALLDKGYTDIVDLLLVAQEGRVSKTLLNRDELYKLTLYKRAPEAVRENYEAVVGEAEDLAICNGKIAFILDCMEVDMEDLSLQTFKLSTFTNYVALFKKLFSQPSDKLRRALLTKGDYLLHDGTTRTLNGARYSFVKTDEEWRTLVKDAKKSGMLKALINEVIQADDVDYALMAIINDYLQTSTTPQEWPYYFVKEEAHLNWCQDKMVCFVEREDGKEDVYLLRGKKVTSPESYKQLLLA